MVEGDDLRTTVVAVFLLHLLQLVLHHLLATLRVVQDLLQVSDQFLQVVELLVELVDTQTRQLCETHVHDSLRLELVEFEAYLQVMLGVTGGLTIPYNMYDLVDIVDGDDQALQDMGALLCFLQVELRAADGHVMTVLHEIFHAFLEVQQTGATLYQSDVIH